MSLRLTYSPRIERLRRAPVEKMITSTDAIVESCGGGDGIFATLVSKFANSARDPTYSSMSLTKFCRTDEYMMQNPLSERITREIGPESVDSLTGNAVSPTTRGEMEDRALSPRRHSETTSKHPAQWGDVIIVPAVLLLWQSKCPPWCRR